MEQVLEDHRAEWRYQVLPRGREVLAEGKGVSPAFMTLLQTIAAAPSATFKSLHLKFPRLDKEDLELWLAGLCRMNMVAPAPEVPPELDAAHDGMVDAVDTVEHIGPIDLFAAPAPAPLPRPAAPGIRATRDVTLLLVDTAIENLLGWRQTLLEYPLLVGAASTLAEVEAALNRERPRAVVIGGGDRNLKPLALVTLLKRPRTPWPATVFLFFDEARATAEEKRVARMADVVLKPGDNVRLALEIEERFNVRAIPRVPLPDRASTTLLGAHAAALLAREIKPAPADSFPLLNEKIELPQALANKAPFVAESVLEQKHPRVVAELSLHWGKPSLERVMLDLILDLRGDRQGFSAQAMEELLLLFALFRDQKPLDQLGRHANGHAHAQQAVPRGSTTSTWMRAQQGSPARARRAMGEATLV